MNICRRTMFALVGWGALSGVAFSQTGTRADTPEAVVQALLSAMDAKDADGIRSAFAPSASQAYGDGAPKSGEAFSRWLESDIVAGHLDFHLSWSQGAGLAA
jgi:hypothetical protein